jgi:hypothetical protein
VKTRLAPLLVVLAAAGIAPAPAAHAAGPLGFSDPVPRGGTARVVATALGAGPAGSAVAAYADDHGDVHAVRVDPDGVVGGDRVVWHGRGAEVRDLHAVVSDRGEAVLVWATFSRRGQDVLEVAATAAGHWGRVRPLGPIGTATGAMPSLAALPGGTVVAAYRDTRSRRVRYARRAPGRPFGPARALAHDGVYPQVADAGSGRALVSYQRGPLRHRVVVVSTAQRGAPLPGAIHPVAGGVRLAAPLAADGHGRVVVSWIAREGGRLRLREVAPRIGPALDLPATFAARDAATVALGQDGALLASTEALRDAFRPTAVPGTVSALGPEVPLTEPIGYAGRTTAVFAPDVALVAFSAARAVPGPPVYDATVAAVAGGAARTATVGPAAGPGEVLLAQGARRTVLAYAASGGGIALAERALP